jgi:signal transduction histidine kinase
MPRLAILGLVLAVAAAGAMVARPTTAIALGGVIDPPGAVLLLAGLALMLLLVGAAIATVVGPRGPALLAVIVAGAFVAEATIGATGVPVMVSTLAAVVAFAGTPALVQLALSWPQARPSRNSERRLVVGIWIVVSVAASAWVLVWDPFSDLGCLLACGQNPLAINPDPRAARSLRDLALLVTVAAGVVTVVLTVRPSRFWPAGIAVLALVFDAVLRLEGRGRVADPSATLLYVARCGSLALVGAALVAAAVRRIRRRHRLARLAASLDASSLPGAYATSLAEVFDDPSLDVGYAVAGQDRYVHANGQPFPGPQEGQVATRLERNGIPVAMVVHQPAHAEAIATGLGAAARLAIDNERLQADLRSQLADLRASRERVVERSDAERLRLERDLHDGAQQRLLMLGHQMRRALNDDPAAAPWLGPVIDDVDAALSEVREIAHGIYPGILESLGLHAALDALADGPAPFILQSAPTGRLDPPIERAAYWVVASAVIAVTASGLEDRSPVTASLTAHEGRLAISVTGVRGLGEQDIEELEDHVGALGGTITIAGDTIGCELPCG